MKVVIGHNVEMVEEPIAMLREFAEVVIPRDGSEETLLAAVRDADSLIVGINPPVPRRVIEAADSRGREGMWLGELATDRVRDFAEFELLYSRASQHLDRGRWDAADAVLPRLVALDRALVSTEIGAMLDELKFRLMISRG